MVTNSNQKNQNAMGGGGSWSPSREVTGGFGPGGKSTGAAGPGPGGSIAAAKANKKNPVQEALEIAAKQRADLGPGVTAAETILGMMPAPGMAAALKLGNMMGAASETALQNEVNTNPNADVHADPNHPGGVFGRIGGMMYSNRADVPGYNQGLGQQAGAAALDEAELIRRKLAAQAKPAAQQPQSPTTLLGSNVDTLGPGVKTIS